MKTYCDACGCDLAHTTASPDVLKALRDLVECVEQGMGQFQMGRRAIAARAILDRKDNGHRGPETEGHSHGSSKP